MLSWLNKNLDKVAHFGVSNFIAFACFLLTQNIYISIAVSFMIGFCKEKKDVKFDKYDVLANGLGILWFVIIVVILRNTWEIS